MSKLDLLCMGRAAVDLYADQIYTSLEEVSSFSKYVGGCPANIAIGSSRLGLRTGILSRVGDEAMGRFVRHTFVKEGVDVRTLCTDKNRLTGLVLLGIDPPGRFPLIFFRENCADMAIEKEDFTQKTFEETQALLITGTHCSQEKAFEVTKHAAKLAKKAGAKVILDIDFRPVLWGLTGHGGGEQRYVAHSYFSERLTTLFSYCDLIVGTEEELRASAHHDTVDGALLYIRQHTQATIVQKRGERGCIVYGEDLNDPIFGEPFPVKVFNVLGAGDAFMSGFLRGYLRELPLEECCNLANANGALVVTRHGCSPAMPYWDELQAFIENPEKLGHVEHLHHVLGRKRKMRDLCLLAFDHRNHFIERFGASKDKSQPLNVLSMMPSKLFMILIRCVISDSLSMINTEKKYSEKLPIPH